MNLTPVKTPVVVKKMFPNYVWEIPSVNKNLYLTFDDGPTPEITEWVLDVLKKHNAKATFFCVGQNADKHPEILNRIINDGHAIGNHTYNHIKGWKHKTKEYLRNIEKASKQINSSFFRPPYGQITPKQGKKLIKIGYKIVMWNVLSFDWDKTIANETCLNNVISNTTDGSIIDFHDSLKSSNNMQYALPKVLDHFSKEGYSFNVIEV